MQAPTPFEHREICYEQKEEKVNTVPRPLAAVVGARIVELLDDSRGLQMRLPRRVGPGPGTWKWPNQSATRRILSSWNDDGGT